MKNLIFFIVINILTFFIFVLSAEEIKFFGSYHIDEKKVIPFGYTNGYVDGCIYSGKTFDGVFMKVHTRKSCPVSSKENVVFAISCDVSKIIKLKFKNQYEIYDAVCEIK